MAASSPRFRRKSSVFIDAVHDLPLKSEMAPAQLYSTESGRLFHSGKIALVTVGLPARGKTSARTPFGLKTELKLSPGTYQSRLLAT